MWQPTDKVRRSFAIGTVCLPFVLFAIPVMHSCGLALDLTVHSTFATSIPAIIRDIVVCLYVAGRVFVREGQKGLRDWAQKGKDAALALVAAFVLTFLYNLFFAAPQQIAKGTLPADPFVVSVEFARVSVGGKAYGTSLWIRYPSRNGSCSGISPIQGMYFLSIKNRLDTPVSVVGYGVDSFGVSLPRVRTQMGTVVGTPNAIDGHFLHPKLHLNDIKAGSFFDFWPRPRLFNGHSSRKPKRFFPRHCAENGLDR
jgi:hypothetical protein